MSNSQQIKNESSEQGEDSQNFLRKFLRFFPNFGP